MVALSRAYGGSVVGARQDIVLVELECSLGSEHYL